MRETYVPGDNLRGPEDDRQENLVEEAETSVETFNAAAAKKRRRRILGFVATGVAATILAGGGFAIGQRGGGNTEAQAPPVATAPANPGEQPAAGASEAASTPATGEVISGSELTLDTFPFETPDGTFTGVESLKQEYQLLVSDYQMDGTDSTKKKIGDLLDDFTKLRAAHMNSGMNQIKSGKFAGFTVKPKDSIFDEVGGKAVCVAYDTAFVEALVDDTTLAGRVEGNHDGVLKGQVTDPSYAVVDIKVSSERTGGEPDYTQYSGKNSNSGRGGVLFSDVRTVSIDSNGKETATIETLDFRRVLDGDREVWKVFRFESANAPEAQG